MVKINARIKMSIVLLVISSILISGCIDSEKPSEIGGPSKSVQSNEPKEWIEMGPYDYIGNSADIGGRLAFYAEKNEERFIVHDGTEESLTTEYYIENVDLVDVGGKLAFKDRYIVYDGKVVGNQYDHVWPPVSVGGKLAYMARSDNIVNQYNSRKDVIVYDGKEYGTEYEGARNPADIGGKLAYVAFNVDSTGALTYFVILDGKKVSIQHGGEIISEFKDIEDSDGVSSLFDVGGKFAFTAQIGNNWDHIGVYDGKSYGDNVYYPKEIGGKLAYFSVKERNRPIIVYDGKEIGTQYDGIDNMVDVDGKLTYVAIKDKTEIIVFDGNELGTQYDSVRSPTDIGGKLAYEAKKDDGEFIVYDRTEIGKQYDQIRDIIDVGGKLAYKAIKDREYFIILEK